MTPDRAAACMCDPRWPEIVVRLDGHTELTVEPSATPGGLASLYRARCTRCGAPYPWPFRLPPRSTAA